VHPAPELARVFVRFDHVASGIANADHNVMSAAAVLGVPDCVFRRVRPEYHSRRMAADAT